MTFLGIPIFEFATLLFAIIAIVLFAGARSKAAKRRVMELEVTANALAAHYDAMDKIVDDPDLPIDVLQFLYEFSDAISRRETCESVAREIFIADPAPSPSPLMTELDRLSLDRPELVEDTHRAFINGIIALYLRWPGYSIFLQSMMQKIATDHRADLLFAETIVRSAPPPVDGHLLAA